LDRFLNLQIIKIKCFFAIQDILSCLKKKLKVYGFFKAIMLPHNMFELKNTNNSKNMIYFNLVCESIIYIVEKYTYHSIIFLT